MHSLDDDEILRTGTPASVTRYRLPDGTTAVHVPLTFMDCAPRDAAQISDGRARTELVCSAAAMAGAFQTTGISDADIRRMAVSIRLGDAAVRGRSDDQVEAQFDALAGDCAVAAKTAYQAMCDRHSNAWRGPSNPAPAARAPVTDLADARKAADAAHAAYVDRVSNAWRTPSSAA